MLKEVLEEREREKRDRGGRVVREITCNGGIKRKLLTMKIPRSAHSSF
jgi:hypothetical protein